MSFRLLIGAPRARALGKQTANITGGIYKCELTLSNDCERVEFDNEGDLSVYNSTYLPISEEYDAHLSVCVH